MSYSQEAVEEEEEEEEEKQEGKNKVLWKVVT